MQRARQVAVRGVRVRGGAEEEEEAEAAVVARVGVAEEGLAALVE